MPTPEGGARPPSNLPNREEPNKEGEQPPYYQAARFPGELLCGQAYFMAQETIYQDEQSDLSVYRLQLDRIWHVAVIGESPSKETDAVLAGILSEGELVTLPPQVLKLLQERREVMSKGGSWVEGHYRPGKRFER